MQEVDRQRASILYQCGAKPSDVAEILVYGQNLFQFANTRALRFPLEDEPFVESWRRYALEVDAARSIYLLRRYLPQMCFPIAEGISQTPDYQSAVRRGVKPDDLPLATGLTLVAPERCRVVVHPTPAGHIPIVIAEIRDDFLSLLRAFLHRNEPAAVATSMGGCMIGGYNNWDRIHRHLDAFTLTHSGASDEQVRQEFERLLSIKSDYQDRFILLSTSDYSAVPAAALGLAEEVWRNASLVIRREHECLHYFTRRVLSSMRNNLLDEIIADYFGIVACCGHFRASWLLRFLGLDGPAGELGRMNNYRGELRLSDSAFLVLQRVLRKAAANLEAFDSTHCELLRRRDAYVPLVLTLTLFSLEEMAAEGAESKMREAFFDRWKGTRISSVSHQEMLLEVNSFRVRPF